MWLNALFDWLHVPVFGLIAVAVYVITPQSWQHWRRFAAAFLAAVLMGILTEAIQIPMQRDAAWEDVVADGIGAAAFLLVVFAIGRGLLGASLAVLAAICLVAYSAQSLFSATLAIYHREAQFPTLFSGDIGLERPFVAERNVELTTHITPPPVRTYFRVEVTEKGEPTLEFHDFKRDWSNYRALHLEIEVEGDTGLDLTIRVHDRLHQQRGQMNGDRFSQPLALQPGVNQIAIPIEAIRNAPAGRTIDASRIAAIIIYGRDVEPGRVFRLYEVWLD
jgi:hypothetical protein